MDIIQEITETQNCFSHDLNSSIEKEIQANVVCVQYFITFIFGWCLVLDSGPDTYTNTCSNIRLHPKSYVLNGHSILGEKQIQLLY